MRVWDISPSVSPSTPAFPGDTPYTQRWNAEIGPGCPVNVSAITMSPHLGAHADAPLHYGANASAIGGVDLTPFLGPCRVIHAIDKGPLITPDHLSHALDAGDPVGLDAPSRNQRGLKPPLSGPSRLPARILVRTCRRAPTEWSTAFSAFAPETIAWLAGLGVRLVGIDSQSVDPAESKTLDSHQQLLKHDMRVLENLVLDEVEPGDYELIALPLKLAYADASPVRAVLRSL
jgi:arylformamidase